MSEKQFDICVFGASGFTGNLVVQYLAEHLSVPNIKWAIAGRNKQKLAHVIEDIPASVKPEIIFADVGDYSSLCAMAESAKVIITTVGPYTLYGEPLVKACIEKKCDYVDLTGEPNFVDTIRYKYHQQAKEAEVKIINACGFDSIPHDLGVLFSVNELKKSFPFEKHKYLQIQCEGYVRTNARFSGGTWFSAVTAMSSMIEHRQLKQLWKSEGYSEEEICEQGRKVKLKYPMLKWKKQFSQLALPMPTIDPEIVKRSAQLRSDYGLRFAYGHYILLQKWWYALVLPFGIVAVFTLAQFRKGRDQLAKVISPGQGPDQVIRDNSWFKVDFFTGCANKVIHTQVSGGDPGYSETSKMLAESALCLVLDKDKLPKVYGVTTTAAAIGESLITRLQTAGIKFEVMDD